MSSLQIAPHTVLVHGLGRTRYDMLLLARRLRRLIPETTVHTFGYASRHLTISQAAEQLDSFIAKIAQGAPVSFVAHSLGGIVVRALDSYDTISAPQHRLVTLGSPHNGATIARILKNYAAMRSLFGPALSELGDLTLSKRSNRLEIGCVIGSLHSVWGALSIFSEDNDGLVLVREAHLEGCQGEIIIPIFHGVFPFSRRAADLSASFLRTGLFLPPQNSAV